MAQVLTRRQLLTTLGLGLGAVAGLRLWRSRAFAPAERQRLLHVKGQGPKAWLQQLPKGWVAQSRSTMEHLAAALQTEAVDLAMVGEAWLPHLRPQLQPFGAPELLEPLLKAAQDPAVLGGGVTAAPVALPWAFGSWVMVFRNQPDWVERSRGEGWSLLAAEALQDAWILPASPRVVVALALQSLGASANTTNLASMPGLAARLAAVVGRARAFDSRHALTRLVNGHGSAAVVPSWTVVPHLLRDQRLVAVRPTISPPLLNWQVLVRPRRAGPIPTPWLQASTKGGILNGLLQAGFCPPLPMEALQPQLARQPAATLLHPGDEAMARAETLQPFTPEQQAQVQQVWDEAMGERLHGAGAGKAA
ncbi:MAG: hypothetical protein F4Z75_05710 [Synechococcus sp. SB0668_bin_15]|nr:hypothetical protein [Synechococcus sp. SB0668_bin_15]MXZ82883.1 hypothetical protein [Synechococcus sp. SB0666_bin_14]MYC49352.1 hypothetical protein [Synechococcus sp. SB0662_bin_14]MYG45954.1 hypothetical protein [Synechococcus sp. SB0675_bin_6]MYK92275.1 hypothetical protein [Synechococcus sp. SB0669_bin_8]